MLIPLKNSTKYGAVHIDNYLSFIGFCKNVINDENRKIEVYIDNVKIDEFLADKSLEKIRKIYDIDGFSFQYELPEKFYDKSHDIKFKSEELLINETEIKTIDPLSENYNKYRFLHSLTLPIDEEKIKDVYCPNSVGFLATEENLNDKEFVEYIKELQKRFSNVEFKIFYLINEQKRAAIEIFKEVNNLEFIIPKNIYEVNENCLVWLSRNDSISLNIRKYVRYALFINFEAKDLSIKEYENKNKNSFKMFYSNPSKFEENDNSSFFGVAYNNLIKSLNSNSSLDINTNYFEFSSFTQIELALKYDKFIEKAKKLSSLLQD